MTIVGLVMAAALLLKTDMVFMVVVGNDRMGQHQDTGQHN